MLDFLHEQTKTLGKNIAFVKSENDKRGIIRAAEHIYNVAHRNDNELTKKLAAHRMVQRCPVRLSMVRERWEWRQLQQSAKLIVEIVNGLDGGA